MSDPDTTTFDLQRARRRSIDERFAIWMALGKAIDLPVDELHEAIALQMDAARRERGGQPAPLSLRERFRLAVLARAIGPTLAKHVAWILKPASAIRWLKAYQQRRAQQRSEPATPPQRGRPPISQEKVEVILRVYDSGLCGLKRIVGECRKCGVEIAKSTVRRVLDAHGLHPGPNRSGQSWTTFVRNHAPEILGIDFIQVATGLLGKVVYRFALVGIEHDTRRAHILGITAHPTHDWLSNVIRAATMDGEPLADRRYWIHDNDGKFQTIDGILQRLGKQSVRTAVRAPDMNAHIERFIRSAREECLDHIVFLSEQHLRHSLTTYLEHYNTERPHQGIGNVVIGPWSQQSQGDIVCDEHLGGLLKSFRRAA